MMKRTKKLPPWHTLPTFWDVMRRCKHDTAAWLKSHNVTDKKSLEDVCASMKMSPPDWSAVAQHFLPSVKEEKKVIPVEVVQEVVAPVVVVEAVEVSVDPVQVDDVGSDDGDDQSVENESSVTSDEFAQAKQHTKKKRRF